MQSVKISFRFRLGLFLVFYYIFDHCLKVPYFCCNLVVLTFSFLEFCFSGLQLFIHLFLIHFVLNNLVLVLLFQSCNLCTAFLDQFLSLFFFMFHLFVGNRGYHHNTNSFLFVVKITDFILLDYLLCLFLFLLVRGDNFRHWCIWSFLGLFRL